MWLEILSLRNIRHTDNRGVVDARDNQIIFLNFFLLILSLIFF